MSSDSLDTQSAIFMALQEKKMGMPEHRHEITQSKNYFAAYEVQKKIGEAILNRKSQDLLQKYCTISTKDATLQISLNNILVLPLMY